MTPIVDMKLEAKINEWLNMARKDDSVTRTRQGTGLGPPTPAAKVISLEQEIHRLRAALAEACYELKRFS